MCNEYIYIYICVVLCIHICVLCIHIHTCFYVCECINKSIIDAVHTGFFFAQKDTTSYQYIYNNMILHTYMHICVYTQIYVDAVNTTRSFRLPKKTPHF